MLASSDSSFPAASSLETVDAYRQLQQMLQTTAPLDDASHDPLRGAAAALVGRLALCRHGRIGRITGRAFTAFGQWAWEGVGLDGTAWCSTHPQLLAVADAQSLLARATTDATVRAEERARCLAALQQSPLPARLVISAAAARRTAERAIRDLPVSVGLVPVPTARAALRRS